MKTLYTFAGIGLTALSLTFLLTSVQRYPDPDSLRRGKALFEMKCTPCHGSKGEGTAGPNLTDRYFLHGNHTHGIAHVIRHGVVNKGMPPFRDMLTHQQVHDLAHYVHSLAGTHVAGGKAPQGKKH
ncbi:MAG: c-type cytochrome [Bacteroidetes bacterium]|nr:c-type cytochrome [Bacteroidota bacterium]